MRAFIAAFSLFAALIVEGNGLDCEQCIERGNMTSCTGPIAACPDSATKCIQGLENNTLDGDIILTAFKSCLVPAIPSIACPIADHIVYNSHILIRFNAVCGMNNDPFQVPQLNATPSGYKCPDCFAEGTMAECQSDQEIVCYGRQNECFDIRAIGHRPGQANKPYSFKGCITANSCALVNRLPSTRATDITTTCTPAEPIK